MKSITACFVDHGGLYLPLALKLAESYGRVLYFDPNETAFPKINDNVIGDGFQSIERIPEFWTHRNEINMFVFPDTQGGDLQSELISQGFRVWGSQQAEKLELSREYFHDVLGRVGLEVPEFREIKGVGNLRRYLRDQTDKYIKISKYRGSLETFHWRSRDDDEETLDAWAVKFGGVKDLIPFLVFDAIDTDIELGADTFCIDGQWPGAMLDGYEWKDKGYLGAFKRFGDMPEQTRAVLDAFGPVLKEAGMRNFWSMEIRVKGDKFYFIDPTPRGPLPGTASQMEIYSNLAEIIANGAMGDLVEPVPAAKFSAECVLTMKSEKHAWGSLRVPDELKQWMKLAACCFVHGRNWFPPDESHGEEIGWMVAIGDTIKETIETMLKQAEALPDGVCAKTESLVDLLKEVHKAEAQGIEFTPQPVPEPEIVVKEP